MFEKAEALAEQYQEVQRKFIETGRSAINEMLEEFWKEFPYIEGLTWNQFTPYFNDGDPCTFGIGEVSVRLSKDGLDFYQIEYDADEVADFANETDLQLRTMQVDSWDLYDYVDRKQVFKTKEVERLRAALCQFDHLAQSLKKVFEVAYGDGHTVTVGRDYLEVDEYDHD